MPQYARDEITTFRRRASRALRALAERMHEIGYQRDGDELTASADALQAAATTEEVPHA